MECGKTSLSDSDNYSTTSQWDTDNFITNSDPQCIITLK